MSFKAALYRHVAVEGWERKGISPFNTAAMILIILSVATAILETERSLSGPHATLFYWLDQLFFGFFLAEYLLRLYVAPMNARYAGNFGRLRYMCSPMAVLDLLVLLPFFFSAGSSEMFMMRLLRIIRILRLARLGRFSKALALLWEAVKQRKFELAMSGIVAFFMLIVSSTFLFLFEAETQPEAFGSIPRALWWSIATLTTVGYGDVTPVTAIGRFFAGITAVIGIGIVAMPTGILAAAFSDAFQRSDLKVSEQQQDD
jgi:voltage-gated potassium channel